MLWRLGKPIVINGYTVFIPTNPQVHYLSPRYSETEYEGFFPKNQNRLNFGSISGVAVLIKRQSNKQIDPIKT